MRNELIWPAAAGLAVVVAAAVLLSMAGGPSDGKLEAALRGDTGSPYRWCDLGEGLLAAGEKEKARYCFDRALELGPNIPPIWLRAAFFSFEVDEVETGLVRSAKVLKLASNYDEVVFGYWDRVAAGVDVGRYLGDNARARGAWERRGKDSPQRR